jgi:regulator of protease activity HflC (stomatin/prohibitin superfamily)
MRQSSVPNLFPLSVPHHDIPYVGMRSAVCTMTLDGAYAGKQELSDYLMKHLQEKFNEFGYSIMSVLIVEINPDAKVMQAMNEINSSRRMKVAALQRAEGEKIIKVKQAEAEAESMHLSGVGVARQRRAIMDGLKESIVNFNQGVNNTSNKDVMDLLILNQYFDTLDAIGAQPGIKTIFLPKAQGGVMTDMMVASAADSVIKLDNK